MNRISVGLCAFGAMVAALFVAIPSFAQDAGGEVWGQDTGYDTSAILDEANAEAGGDTYEAASEASSDEANKEPIARFPVEQYTETLAVTDQADALAPADDQAAAPPFGDCTGKSAGDRCGNGKVKKAGTGPDGVYYPAGYCDECVGSFINPKILTCTTVSLPVCSY